MFNMFRKMFAGPSKSAGSDIDNRIYERFRLNHPMIASITFQGRQYVVDNISYSGIGITAFPAEYCLGNVIVHLRLLDESMEIELAPVRVRESMVAFRMVYHTSQQNTFIKERLSLISIGSAFEVMASGLKSNRHEVRLECDENIALTLQFIHNNFSELFSAHMNFNFDDSTIHLEYAEGRLKVFEPKQDQTKGTMADSSKIRQSLRAAVLLMLGTSEYTERYLVSELVYICLTQGLGLSSGAKEVTRAS